jgi:pimeloyl-ACP methyl ester carboxylesterase
VAFGASDGVGLRGRLFGRPGKAAVVLVHMGQNSSNEADWFGLARRLARAGYAVLAYNRRGVCSGDGRYDCSGGLDDWPKAWQDVAGAVRFLEARGVRRYVVMGSSIGASSALKAASSGVITPAGFVDLAGVNYMVGYTFSQRDLRAFAGPKLFVSANHDPDDAQRTAREWYGWAQAPRRLALLDSGRHGTDMLAPSQPTHARLMALLTGFVRTALPRGD